MVSILRIIPSPVYKVSDFSGLFRKKAMSWDKKDQQSKYPLRILLYTCLSMSAKKYKQMKVPKQIYSLSRPNMLARCSLKPDA